MLQMIYFTPATSVILIPRSWMTVSAAQALNAGGLAGNGPKRPHYPSATDLVGMKFPGDLPRLTQNERHWLLSEW